MKNSKIEEIEYEISYCKITLERLKDKISETVVVYCDRCGHKTMMEQKKIRWGEEEDYICLSCGTKWKRVDRIVLEEVKHGN